MFVLVKFRYKKHNFFVFFCIFLHFLHFFAFFHIFLYFFVYKFYQYEHPPVRTSDVGWRTWNLRPQINFLKICEFFCQFLWIFWQFFCQFFGIFCHFLLIFVIFLSKFCQCFVLRSPNLVNFSLYLGTKFAKKYILWKF